MIGPFTVALGIILLLFITALIVVLIRRNNTLSALQTGLPSGSVNNQPWTSSGPMVNQVGHLVTGITGYCDTTTTLTFNSSSSAYEPTTVKFQETQSFAVIPPSSATSSSIQAQPLLTAPRAPPPAVPNKNKPQKAFFVVGIEGLAQERNEKTDAYWTTTFSSLTDACNKFLAEWSFAQRKPNRSSEQIRLEHDLAEKLTQCVEKHRGDANFGARFTVPLGITDELDQAIDDFLQCLLSDNIEDDRQSCLTELINRVSQSVDAKQNQNSIAWIQSLTELQSCLQKSNLPEKDFQCLRAFYCLVKDTLKLPIKRIQPKSRKTTSAIMLEACFEDHATQFTRECVALLDQFAQAENNKIEHPHYHKTTQTNLSDTFRRFQEDIKRCVSIMRGD